MFLGKALYSHSDSLQPGVEMETVEFNTGVSVAWDLASHPVGGRRDTPSSGDTHRFGQP